MKLKKMLIGILMGSAMMSASVFANNYDTTVDMLNIGVVKEEVFREYGIETRGTGKPNKTHDLINDGELFVCGTAQGSKLYTDSYFTGASKVNVSIKNSSRYDLTVRIYKKGDRFLDSKVKTITVDAKHTFYTTLRDLNPNAKYYVTFEAPSNFSGTFEAQ